MVAVIQSMLIEISMSKTIASVADYISALNSLSYIHSLICVLYISGISTLYISGISTVYLGYWKKVYLLYLYYLLECICIVYQRQLCIIRIYDCDKYLHLNPP